MKNLIKLLFITSFIYASCPTVAPNSSYSFVEDDCGNCWLPYCYNMGTHEVLYDLTEQECNYLWVNPGDPGDPYYNGYCDSCPSGFTVDSCGSCWKSYCYTFFSSGIGDDPTHSVYYDLSETECNDLGYNFYTPGTPGDPYFDSNCTSTDNDADDEDSTTACTDSDLTNFGFSSCTQAISALGGCDAVVGPNSLSVYCPVSCNACDNTDDSSDNSDGGTTGGDDTLDCANTSNGLGEVDDCNVCHAQLCYNTVTHVAMPAQTCDGENEMWASPNNPMNPSWNASCEDCNGVANGTAANGDLNSDGIINIADVVHLVNYILGATQLNVSCGDANDDGFLNVSDVISIVNIILADRSFGNEDAISSDLIINDDSIRLESDGFVQGVHIILSHNSKFKINLVDALISEFRTIDNMTNLIVVTDGSQSITDIATFEGDITIESVHVVNQSGDVNVEQVIELSSIEVKVVGPNPFNPSTQISVAVPEAGLVSVYVYNVLGQKVATLVDGYMDANISGHIVNFNASHLASGVYLVQAISADKVATQKLMLLK